VVQELEERRERAVKERTRALKNKLEPPRARLTTLRTDSFFFNQLQRQMLDSIQSIDSWSSAVELTKKNDFSRISQRLTTLDETT
jgi:hypothetical protein